MIRHGATKGNMEYRYVGSTDEGLLLESVASLRKKTMPKVDEVYVSPMKRCRETARILYGEQRQIVVDAFRECDFGRFEYCNYKELNGDAAYQRFIDTMGKCGFPGGEDRKAFQERCVKEFDKIVRSKESHKDAVAMVVHGGTIMAVLDHYSQPHKEYYEWRIENESGFVMETVWSEWENRFYLTNISKLQHG